MTLYIGKSLQTKTGENKRKEDKMAKKILKNREGGKSGGDPHPLEVGVYVGVVETFVLWNVAFFQ